MEAAPAAVEVLFIAAFAAFRDGLTDVDNDGDNDNDDEDDGRIGVILLELYVRRLRKDSKF